MDGCTITPARCKLTVMPELPDITAYIAALEPRILGQRLEQVRVGSAFLLRTALPPLSSAEGRIVHQLRRIGKRIAIGLEGDLWLVLHLMIAGRLHWKQSVMKLAGRNSLAAFDFATGSLVLTEAGTKRRASLHVLSGEKALQAMDPGGIEIASATLDSFRTALSAENRTLKRALTDPHIVSGIGNAYSDEILHAAQLSPVKQTRKLEPQEWEHLFTATSDMLQLWTERLVAEAGSAFPEKVTAFREDMQYTGGSVSLALGAGRKFSASGMRTMRPITVLAARPRVTCWQIEVFRGCLVATGHGRWKSWRVLRSVLESVESFVPAHVIRPLLKDSFQDVGVSGL